MSHTKYSGIPHSKQPSSFAFDMQHGQRRTTDDRHQQSMDAATLSPANQNPGIHDTIGDHLLFRKDRVGG